MNLDKENGTENTREMMVALAARRRDIMQSASNNLRKAHIGMKKRHDIGSKEHDYETGDYCYLYVPSLLVPRTSKKMQSQYIGPYIITKFTSKYTCLLMRCQDGKCNKRPVHVQRLRKPRVRDKAFLKRLHTVPTNQLMDTDKIVKAKLTPKDTVLIGAGVAPRKNHSKLSTHTTNTHSQINMGAMFNSKHQNVAFNNTLTET